MRRFSFAFIVVLSFISITVAQQGFNLYPGAKLDEALTKAERALLAESIKEGAPLPKGQQVTLYSTPDDFDKVCNFYRGIIKEFEGGRFSSKLSEGQKFRSAIFIFDGAADTQKSKSWIRVQRPYIPEDEVGEDNPKVHDITVITHYEIK
jgi:hypothetical protein